VRSLEGRRGRATAQLAGETVAKSSVEDDVDDEVDGSIDSQHRVGYLADCLDQVAVGLRIAEVEDETCN